MLLEIKVNTSVSSDVMDMKAIADALASTFNKEEAQEPTFAEGGQVAKGPITNDDPSDQSEEEAAAEEEAEAKAEAKAQEEAQEEMTAKEEADEERRAARRERDRKRREAKKAKEAAEAEEAEKGMEEDAQEDAQEAPKDDKSEYGLMELREMLAFVTVQDKREEGKKALATAGAKKVRDLDDEGIQKAMGYLLSLKLEGAPYA